MFFYLTRFICFEKKTPIFYYEQVNSSQSSREVNLKANVDGNGSNTVAIQQPLTPRSLNSQAGKSSFQKLLEPSIPQRSAISPYRIVLGDVKDKVMLSDAFVIKDTFK